MQTGTDNFEDVGTGTAELLGHTDTVSYLETDAIFPGSCLNEHVQVQH